MRRFLLIFLGIVTVFAAAPRVSRGSEPLPFNTIVVKHFTNANGMALSQAFIGYFADSLRERLVKDKTASQVVEEGIAVPDAAAANSLVIEGKYLSHQNAGLLAPGKLVVEISIYRLSDHAQVKTWDATTMFPPNGDHRDKVYAFYTASVAGDLIWNALKSVNLSAIPAAAPGAGAAAGGAGAGAPGGAATGPDAVAVVQLMSDPAGAEITIDGGYVGVTPSQINLKPGVHSVKMTMNGYMPWVRSIETEGGETRNLIAALTRTNP